MHEIDGLGATGDKKFTAGDPAQAIPATEVTADWLNAVQDELVNVIVATGMALDKANVAQLLAALQSLGLKPATEGAIGVLKIATTEEVAAGTDNTKAVTPAGLAGSMSLSSNGYYKFPGGLIIQWGVGYAAGSGLHDNAGFLNILPIAFLTTCTLALAIHRGGNATSTNIVSTATGKTFVSFESANVNDISLFYFAIGY